MQVNGPEGWELARKKSLAISVACMAIYWPTPGFKGRNFKALCSLCVRSSPLRDLHGKRDKQTDKQPGRQKRDSRRPGVGGGRENLVRNVPFLAEQLLYPICIVAYTPLSPSFRHSKKKKKSLCSRSFWTWYSRPFLNVNRPSQPGRSPKVRPTTDVANELTSYARSVTVPEVFKGGY